MCCGDDEHVGLDEEDIADINESEEQWVCFSY